MPDNVLYQALINVEHNVYSSSTTTSQVFQTFMFVLPDFGGPRPIPRDPARNFMQDAVVVARNHGLKNDSKAKNSNTLCFHRFPADLEHGSTWQLGSALPKDERNNLFLTLSGNRQD